ncbi:MAG: hypothetical protein IJ455_05015 [Agathobacter sp.]|nr:hypothetical protein [Agathobacter sp.]
MLKAWRSYWAFTNDLYKLMMLVVVPVALIATNIYLVARGHGDGLLTLFALYFIDTVSDLFFMNGFYRKSNSSLEFLQSSPKFARFVKEITIIDIVRRVLVYQIPFVVELIGAADSAEKLQWCKGNAFWPWLAILIAQLVVFVARHFVVWSQMYACIVAGYMVLMFCFLLIIIVGSGSPVITNLVLIVLILVMSMVTVWYTNKKVRESYYDS